VFTCAEPREAVASIMAKTNKAEMTRLRTPIEHPPVSHHDELQTALAVFRAVL
jgi:hypothetical protein